MIIKSSCRGNALFIIFLVIGLVAAFSYAVSMATRASGNIATDNSAELYADQWITYGTQVSAAVTRMRAINRCKPMQIDFGGLTNATVVRAGAADACKIMNEAGGGMSQLYRQFPYEWVTMTSGVPPFAIYIIPVQGFGTTDINNRNTYEFFMALQNVKPALCTAVNKRAGITSTSHAFPVTPIDYTWTGGFATPVIASQFTGKKFGCISPDNGATFAIYHIVMV